MLGKVKEVGEGTIHANIRNEVKSSILFRGIKCRDRYKEGLTVIVSNYNSRLSNRISFFLKSSFEILASVFPGTATKRINMPLYFFTAAEEMWDNNKLRETNPLTVLHNAAVKVEKV